MSDRKTGVVVPLTRTKCPCGWLVPKNIAIVGAVPMGDCAVSFRCPICTRTLEQTMKVSLI